MFLCDVFLYGCVVVVLVEEVILFFVVEWFVGVVYLIFVWLEVVCCVVRLIDVGCRRGVFDVFDVELVLIFVGGFDGGK